jgi:protease-4
MDMFDYVSREVIRVAVWGLGVLMVFVLGTWFFGAWYSQFSMSLQYPPYPLGCNIAVVPITGEIAPFSEMPPPPSSGDEEAPFTPYPSTSVDAVLSQIRYIQSDPYIQGVLVRIDSPGGTPVASQAITDALRVISLPTAAVIRDMGTSGGYMVATAADRIFASSLSIVGSIGITMSYLDDSEKKAKEGVRFVSLSSGPFKDMLYPGKPLTGEERALLERDLKESHDDFVALVAENRNMNIEDVAVLADGSAMTGRRALEKGLVDALGDQETARQWFATQLGISSSEVVFCE